MEIREGYTRISKIIGQWNQFAHIDPTVLANKCRIGTNVHQQIDAELQGIFLECELDEKGYFESWQKWWKKEGEHTELISTEQRFYCEKFKITGCVDAILKNDRGLFIVDYKTSASVRKKMWALQAAFYYYLANENDMKTGEEVLFLRLKKDGKMPALYRFTITDDLWKVCECVMSTYRYFND